MNNILEVKNLNKNYEKFSLKDVSFSLNKGFIMGFIGPNGSGKTTTIKSILNMISFESGEINLLGFDSKSDDTDLKNKLGVVMDNPFYLDDWKVKEVEKAVSIFYDNWEHEKYLQLINRFNLDLNTSVKELSRGMKVKLMISVALSHNAELLILDEPTSGLDPSARDEIMEILQEFIENENNSILFSTHITSDLEKIADYITFILNGKIIFTGLKDNLIEKYKIVKGGEISEEYKKYLIGYRKYSMGFEGMIESKNTTKLPKDIIAERITLDEIIIFMTKGEKTYE